MDVSLEGISACDDDDDAICWRMERIAEAMAR